MLPCRLEFLPSLLNVTDEEMLDLATETSDDIARARELVLTYGWNSTAYQSVNPGMTLWFARGGDAVVAVVNEPSFSPGALYSIAAAFSDRSPISAIVGALGRAAGTELGWLRRRVERRRGSVS